MYNHIYFLWRNSTEHIIQSQVYEMIKLVKDKGNHVLIIIFKNNQHSYTDIKKMLGKYQLEENCLIIDNYSFFNLYKKIKEIRTYILREFNLNIPTLMQCRDHIATYMAIKVKKSMKVNSIKVLYDNRGLPVEENRNNDLISLIKNKINIFIIKKVAKNCDIYSFVTNNM